jgi:electron transport complex protein RnfG
MNDMFKTGIVLMIYTTLAGLILGVVYTITKPKIETAELNNKLNAIEFVLKSPIDTDKLLVSRDEIIKAVNGNNQSGEIYKSDNGRVLNPVYKFPVGNKTYYVLTGSSAGFGGNVITVASFVKEGKRIDLLAIKVIDYSQETPGLGATIANEDAQKRFYPMTYEALKKGLKVDKDAGQSNLDPSSAKLKGVVKVSDVMTGATITPRAIVRTLNTMFSYLGGDNNDSK